MTDATRITNRVAVDPILLASCREYMQLTGATAKHCVDEGLRLFLGVRVPAILDVLQKATSHGEIPNKRAHGTGAARQQQSA